MNIVRFLLCPTAAVIPLLLMLSAAHAAPSAPPANPFLASSYTAIAHNESAQQDSVPHRGPGGPSRVLQADEIQYNHMGPGHFGALVSGVYADGRRVFWGNGIDRIVKVDHDTYEVLDEYFFPGAEVYDELQAEESIARFNESNEGVVALYYSLKQMSIFRSLANLYTLLDKDHTYFVGSISGLITAYGDADPEDSRSAIVKKAEFQLPPEATGPVMGINMSFDGWLIVVTEHGYVVAVKRDFSEYRITRLKFSEGVEDEATSDPGRGWIRNSLAIDKNGGIYIASQDHMHKVVWTGSQLSTDEAMGAWTASYLNSWGAGTGATPSLMGFGDEDRFVVITDGEYQMNVVLFWRDGVPADWQAPQGAPDRRIAGMQKVTMGDPGLTEIQSEQSVVVAGYGALVVNNAPRNVPWYLPEQAARNLLVSVLGSNPLYQPYGVQKFAWDPLARQFKNDWVNSEISSPSCVPLVSAGSNLVYLIGARDNQWTLEALDWSTGKSDFHYVIGDQRYNVLFAGTQLDEEGRINYGTPWGRVRLAPKD